MNRDTVAKDWWLRGFSCDLWVDPPGQVWSDYVHDVDELVMVLEGEVEFQMKGRQWRPEPGKEVLIPARTTHTVCNVGKVTSRVRASRAATI